MRKGYIQVYTGNGNGKTTAALGLAMRAAGAGLRTFIAQFMKEQRCSEHVLLEELSDRVMVKQYGKGFLRGKNPPSAHVKAAQAGLREVKEVLVSGEYDLVILDEANVAAHYGLISVDDLVEVMTMKPANVELVITGRYADERVMKQADLVTEMREIKHYGQKGVMARRGIEK